MPGRIPFRARNGAQSYGTPMIPQYGGGGFAVNPVAQLDTGMGIAPFLGAPQITLGWPANGMAPQNFPRTPSNDRRAGILATGGGPRSFFPRGGARDLTWPGGVAAQTPQSAALGGPRALLAGGTMAPGYGTRGPNVVNPLFGRPGFSYVYAQPAKRIGPNLKGAPGTGRTSTGIPSDRSRGFVPAAHATEQYMDLHQFDYTPANDPNYNVGANNTYQGPELPYMPKEGAGVGVNGRGLVGTYDPHDFVVGVRFFKQGRSAANWQDMSYGPEYRYLLPYQQVGKYNLYNNISPSRPLSPNNYFLGYQTQAGVAQRIGGVVGQGRPLGYGAS